MLTENKDIIVLVATIAAALLGAVITLLALAPILGDIISRYNHGFFQTAQQRGWLRRLLGILLLIAAKLATALILVCVAILLPCHQGVLSLLALWLTLLAVAIFLGALGVASIIARRFASSAQ